jgi:hypothetical protein
MQRIDNEQQQRETRLGEKSAERDQWTKEANGKQEEILFYNSDVAQLEYN